MKHLNPAIPIVLGFVGLCAALVLCEVVSDKEEEKTNLFYHYYSIQPESLLHELEVGDVNAFHPIDEEPPFIPLDQQITVPWTQDDYLRIANALYEFVRGETVDGWELHTMNFSLRCEELDIGFQDGNFEFFKIAKTGERESRIQLIINIYPRGQYVFITENEYYPQLVDWDSIDLGQIQLSATDVLRIAENAGGQVNRLSVENACNISLSLSPGSARYKGWFVHYYRRDDRTTLFQVNIDPITGEIHSP